MVSESVWDTGANHKMTISFIQHLRGYIFILSCLCYSHDDRVESLHDVQGTTYDDEIND